MQQEDISSEKDETTKRNNQTKIQGQTCEKYYFEYYFDIAKCSL